MTHIVRLRPVASPEHRIAAIIEDYGAWRVLAASFRALVRRSSRPRNTRSADLSAHVRRDIGLAPEAAVRRYWDLG